MLNLYFQEPARIRQQRVAQAPSRGLHTSVQLQHAICGTLHAESLTILLALDADRPKPLRLLKGIPGSARRVDPRCCSDSGGASGLAGDCDGHRPIRTRCAHLSLTGA